MHGNPQFIQWNELLIWNQWVELPWSQWSSWFRAGLWQPGQFRSWLEQKLWTPPYWKLKPSNWAPKLIQVWTLSRRTGIGHMWRWLFILTPQTIWFAELSHSRFLHISCYFSNVSSALICTHGDFYTSVPWTLFIVLRH